jgi:hypothetical protein
MPTPEIESCRCGRVVIIDGQVHEQDIIILPDRVVGGWWRKERHALHPDDLKALGFGHNFRVRNVGWYVMKCHRLISSAPIIVH